MSGPNGTTRSSRTHRPWSIALPSALAVLGVVLLGPDQLRGAAFVAGALAAAAAAVVHGRRA